MPTVHAWSSAIVCCVFTLFHGQLKKVTLVPYITGANQGTLKVSYNASLSPLFSVDANWENLGRQETYLLEAWSPRHPGTLTQPPSFD